MKPQALFIGIFFLLAILYAQGQAVDGIVAIVNDQVILFSDLKAEIIVNHPESLLASIGTPSPDQWQQSLEETIDRQLLCLHARKRGIKPDNQKIDTLVNRQYPLCKELVLNSNLMNPIEQQELTGFRNKLNQIETEKYIVRQLITSLITINEQEKIQFEQQLIKANKPRVSYRLAQIFLRCPGDSPAEQLTAVEKKAFQIRRELEDGGDFAALALKYSQDTSSRRYGGYLGWLDEGTFLTELQEAVAELKENEISEPIRSPMGFHIIKLMEKVTPEERLFARKFEAEKARLVKQLRQEANIKMGHLQEFIGQ